MAIYRPGGYHKRTIQFSGLFSIFWTYSRCSYSDLYVENMHGGVVDREIIDVVTGLFPKLILSRGQVKDARNVPMPTYSVSTIAGMSGSPLIMSGEVIGKSTQ